MRKLNIPDPAPCSHPDKRARGMCQSCYSKWAYRNVPGKRESMAAASVRHVLSGGQRRTYLKYRFNITPEQYDELLAKQNGVCALCKQPPKNTRLAIDHDHSCCSGRRCCGKCIRGLLCLICNRRVIGFIEAQQVNLQSLVAYLA